jgi:hypothetical protein
MSRRVSHAIEIDGSPAAVWATLTDLDSFPSWNPFMLKVEGDLRVGGRLAVTIQPPGRRASTFRPTVLAVEPERELRWLGRILIPGLFDGEHRFLLEAVPGGTRLTQAERFSGILVAPLKRSLDGTELGFRAMNEALKARAEQVKGNT